MAMPETAVTDKSHKEYISARNKNITPLDEHTKKNFDLQLKDILGIDIQRPKDYYEYYLTLQCYKDEKIPLPATWTDDHMEQLRKTAVSFWQEFHSDTKTIDIIIEKATHELKSLLNSDQHNFAFVASHDSMVFPLAVKYFGHNIPFPHPTASIYFAKHKNGIDIVYDSKDNINNKFKRTVDKQTLSATS
jgi:hypothetical protein